MKRVTIVAIIVALVLLAGGSYVVWSVSSPPGEDNNGPVLDDAVDSVNKTLAVPAPVPISPTDERMALGLAYQGKGNESYQYQEGTFYGFNITAVPAPGYTGNVLIKIFGEVEQGDPTDLIVKDPQGQLLNWTVAEVNEGGTVRTVASGDLMSWKCNGTDRFTPFQVLFFVGGNYSLTVQAFDLDAGRAISPSVATPSLTVGRGP